MRYQPNSLSSISRSLKPTSPLPSKSASGHGPQLARKSVFRDAKALFNGTLRFGMVQNNPFNMLDGKPWATEPNHYVTQSAFRRLYRAKGMRGDSETPFLNTRDRTRTCNLRFRRPMQTQIPELGSRFFIPSTQFLPACYPPNTRMKPARQDAFQDTPLRGETAA